MRKIFLIFTLMFLLTACGKSNEIVFKSGEKYSFNDFRIYVIDDEEEMTSHVIFNSKDDKDKEEKIIDVLSNLETADESMSLASIPNRNSLIIEFSTDDSEDALYMYDSERYGDTGKFHYSFSGEVGGREVTLLSDEDMIGKIKGIIGE